MNEQLKKLEKDLEIKIKKFYDKKIETEIKPQIREEVIEEVRDEVKEEVREEFEAKAEKLMEQLAISQQNDFHLFGGHNCTDPERKACCIEFRRMTILSLIAQGWITDKNIMKSDFLNGKIINKR